MAPDEDAASAARLQENRDKEEENTQKLKTHTEDLLRRIKEYETVFNTEDKKRSLLYVDTSVEELQQMAEVMLQGIDETQQRTIMNFKGVAQRVGEMSGIKEEDLFSTPREAWERLWGVSDGLEIIASRMVDAAASTDTSSMDASNGEGSQDEPSAPRL